MTVSLTQFISSLKDNSGKLAYANAVKREQGIPIYEGSYLRSLNVDQLQNVKDEWADCWLNGAGVIIITGFYADRSVVDEMSDVIYKLLEKEQGKRHVIGDHFAKQGANQRIWNALEKSAIENPLSFINYYSNHLLGAVSEAWLGPGYQLTAQVNLVPPGGSPGQAPHRDYHLGFQADDKILRFPLHAQTMSAMLTLQGAIAHVDMPLDSGPTRVLPFSQQYKFGYQIYRQDGFKSFFDQHAVQLPMSLGDAIFFNPALMHGAGSNLSSDIQRLANLLQISSPFGIPMEMINHERIQLICFETLRLLTLDESALDTLATVMSDSYPFPTNLDRDTPDSSLTPTSSKQLLIQALNEGMEKSQLAQLLESYRWRRQTV